MHDRAQTASSITDLFHRCWRLQNCDSCLASSDACAWCAVSQTCVPNTDQGTLLPILAPIRNVNICPLGWQERWELRTKTFGCRCSTMTLMSVVVAVLSSLLGVLLIWVAVRLGLWGVRKWKRRGTGWWRLDHMNINGHWLWTWQKQKRVEQQPPEEIEDSETRSLLG